MVGNLQFSCLGKHSYETKQLAEEQFIKTRRRRIVDRGGPFKLEAYKCSMCGQWHVGHTPKPYVDKKMKRKRRNGRVGL